jgi:hypothetical protein
MKILVTVVALFGVVGCGQQTKSSVWVAVNRPREFKAHCMKGFLPRTCYFSIDGFWRSTSGAGDEIAYPEVISVVCFTEDKKCTVTDAFVNDNGELGTGSYDLNISLWTDDQIIATTIGGLCEMGDQITVDIPNQTVMRRTYPTKPQTAPCDGAYSLTATYVLHTGYWQLQPSVGKTFQGNNQ